jgi:Polyketide cyclase / dehydrase and lipid transport
MAAASNRARGSLPGGRGARWPVNSWPVTGWPVWSPLGSFRLEREGRDGGEGLGAIRVFRTATVSSHEEIVAYEPGRSFSYSALSGMPIRSHRADVELTGRDGGTAITWREDFVAMKG